MKRIVSLATSVAVAMVLAGCSGSNISDVSASISPASLSISTGQSQQFVVSLGESPYSGSLTWAVNGVAGGNSTTGTITPGTAAGTAIYTAPQTVPNPNQVTVSASQSGTAAQGGQLFASISATVTIAGMAGTTPSASISVSPSTIASNQTATLSWSSANVQNCTINGETMLNGVSVGTSGSIQVSPSQTTSYVLECTGDNGSASAQAQLVVQAGGEIGISISPSTGTLASGASMQFVATVVNDASDQGVRWSASFGSAPSATAANSFTATYTAPTVTQNTNVQITATSVADPSVSSAVTITVTPSGSTPSGPPQAGITPDSATITPGVSQTLIATISGDGVTSQAFTWVLNPAQGVTDPGTLVQTAPNTAIYTSPNINSLVTVQIVATSVQFPNVSGYSTIESGPATTDTKH